jgi:hypothetical protein
MRAAKTLITAISILVLICGAVANAFGVTLTVGDAEVNTSLNNSVAVDVIVDDPSEIAGAAFTVSYDTQALELVAVESDFFAPFVDQFSQLPGAGTPFVNPQDSKTYIPFTVGANTVYIPAEEIIEGENFTQPVMVGPETAIGSSIVAARVMAGEQHNPILFRLTFDVSKAAPGDYEISIVPTVIDNTQAGYSASGEAVPMLIGAMATGAGQDLTEPAAFPQIVVATVHNGTITVTSTDQLAIANKPAEAPTVAAGTSSETFTVTGGDDRRYTWTVTDGNGRVMDTQYGNTYTFTAPATGAFAGIYTVTTVDYQGTSDSFAVKVPMTITPATLSFTERNLDGTDNPQTFIVTGADGDYTWEILSSKNVANAVDNPEVYGTWTKSSPVYADNTNIFVPADVENIQSFYIRVTVVNDTDLVEANGLNSRTVGPFRLVPVDTFRVVVSDNQGVIDGTHLVPGDITVRETSTQQTKNLISYNGEVDFLLPDAGGTFQYEIKDTRTQSIYIDQVVSSATKTTYVALEKEGLDIIEGHVADTFGQPVADATVLAYQPSDVSVQHKTATSSDGSYAIYLPQGAPLNGWVVVASHNSYVSQKQVDQAIGTVDFIGSFAFYTETTIKNIATTIGESSIQVDITANPPISDVSEVDIMLASGPGSIGEPVITDNIDAGSTVTIMYDRVHSFSLAIRADTSEDFNPNSGYWASHSFEYVVNNQVKASSQTKLDKNGGNASLKANNQTATAEIPAGGVTTEEATVTIEQIQTGGGETPTYAYEITAIDDQSGMELTDDEINYIEITLPIDLSVVNPGDLENGTVVIYHAEDFYTLEANGGVVVPNADIISTDYIGDGQTGSVTFSVGHLSVFEISVPAAAGSGSVAGSTGGGGGCFIATASHNSARDLYVAILNQLLSAYQRFAE